MPKFSKRSLDNLSTCHPILQALAHEAIKHCDFTVIEGHRDEGKQLQAYMLGHSKVKWPRSKHNQLPSMAFDAIPYPFLGWSGEASEASFEAMGDAMLDAWQKLPQSLIKGYSLHWGGTWKMRDMPHFEIREIK
jgi:peptidoglycan L-alanyl-D-glutamate endopeptidase CwlK